MHTRAIALMAVAILVLMSEIFAADIPDQSQNALQNFTIVRGECFCHCPDFDSKSDITSAHGIVTSTKTGERVTTGKPEVITTTEKAWYRRGLFNNW